MKILHVIAGAATGGAETFCLDAITALAERGIEQRVTCRPHAQTGARLGPGGGLLPPRERGGGAAGGGPSLGAAIVRPGFATHRRRDDDPAHGGGLGRLS